jgi:hypothetical protein
MDRLQERVSIETDRYHIEGALTPPSEGPRLRHRRQLGRRRRAAPASSARLLSSRDANVRVRSRTLLTQTLVGARLRKAHRDKTTSC